MAAALPLRDIPAWRVYLGLPLCGDRLPEGGLDEFFRLGYEDAVLKNFDPISRQAVDEFPGALAALHDRLPISPGPIGLIGASVGAFVALGVLADLSPAELPVSTVALVSPAIRLRSVVTRNERLFDVTYPWNAASRAVADRLDFVARAPEIAARDVALLLAVGALDDQVGFHEPAEALWRELSATAPDRTALVRVPGVAHALAEEPGLEPAPPSPQAARVDAAVTDWFHRHFDRAQPRRVGSSQNGRDDTAL